MHEQLLARAVNPARVTILRKRMMVYSLAHELLLFGEENAFLTASSTEFNALPVELQIQAVIRATDICCVAEKPVKWRRWKKSKPKIRALEYAPAIAQFWNYLSDGRLQFNAELPTDNEAPVRYVGAPEILRLYQFIISNVPRAEIEIWGTSAWDFPYSFAKMLSQAHAENLGNLEIYNFKQKAHEDFVETCEAGRAAWLTLRPEASNEEKLAVLKKHPVIRELPDIAPEIEKLESTSYAASKPVEKEASCPA